jgi:hypothetical protein
MGDMNFGSSSGRVDSSPVPEPAAPKPLPWYEVGCGWHPPLRRQFPAASWRTPRPGQRAAFTLGRARWGGLRACCGCFRPAKGRSPAQGRGDLFGVGTLWFALQPLSVLR